MYARKWTDKMERSPTRRVRTNFVLLPNMENISAGVSECQKLKIEEQTEM